MRRSRFLPLFFTFLSIAFVIALYFRLRSDMSEPAKTTIAAPGKTTSPSTTTVQSSGETMTLEPVPASGQLNGQSPNIHLLPAPNATAARAITSTPRLQPQPRPSAISRVLAPIVKAFTPSSASKSPASSRPTAMKNPQPPSSVAQSPSSQNGSQRSTEPETSKDPNSDSTPPRLLAVEFIPPQVHDGDEATVIVTAIDDLSGIRGVSGTMSSPTGKALQGFATQRDGETNRYIGHVAIAKDAEEGIWRVSFLNMSDNASNAVTLSFAQGGVPPSAVLRVVSSNSDSTPPTLKNIWIERRAIRSGEKDVISVEATDDKSGVNLVSAVFQSPSKAARIGAGCLRGEGDVWRCELTIPTCVDCGDWQMEQVTLQDKANNLATFRMDNPLVQAAKINISGDSCDNTAPLLQSLTLDNRDVDVSRGATTVVVTVTATDDNCGVSGVSGQYTGPGTGSGGFFPLQQSGDPNTFTGRILLDAHAARGTWRINSIQLNDKGHNLRVYNASDPLLAGAVFHVR
ncbi:MAG: hypothetical protein M3041_11685 [Acidobacteriota bacterium]|nr:hypothetical protein [Acidobacteriota bacterium]